MIHTSANSRTANQLKNENSPYLLQHAFNPVNWRPWGNAAFEDARQQDKPIFLSVGYATCHWCHVMAHESFEDTEVANLLNKHFICIKVDREERPDIDDIYMTATQLSTGRGGWPNSVWLTPDLRPWYAGTYFPKQTFLQLLEELTSLWNRKRRDIERQADHYTSLMRNLSVKGEVSSSVKISDTISEILSADLQDSFDKQYGGFGPAPKFPPHTALSFLTRRYEYKPDEEDRELLEGTLNAMMEGGIHDHVGGGFHRYSTDAQWHLPHFEKMIYDNAQLGRIYAEAWKLTKNSFYKRTAEKLFDWILRDMTSPDGLFYSAIDADSGGEEGQYYVWKKQEIMDIIGEENSPLYCKLYGVRENGNYRDERTGQSDGNNVLHFPISLHETMIEYNMSEESIFAFVDEQNAKLLDVRRNRVSPAIDDKIIASTNGLMIRALAQAGELLQSPRYRQAAVQAADSLTSFMINGKRLSHSIRKNKTGTEGFLEDYAFVIDGLLALYDSIHDDHHLKNALELTKTMKDLFQDKQNGAFFQTPENAENLLYRHKNPYDKAIPSGNGIIVFLLVKLHTITGKQQYFDDARNTLQEMLYAISRAPQATASLVESMDIFIEVKNKMHKSADAHPEKEKSVVRQPPLTIEITPHPLELTRGADRTIHITIKTDPNSKLNDPHNVKLAIINDDIESIIHRPKTHDSHLHFNIDLHTPTTVAPGTGHLDFELTYQVCDQKQCHPLETLDFSTQTIITR